MIKSVKANLLLNINDTHNVLCTTYFVIVWFKNQNFCSCFNELLFFFSAGMTC